MKAVISVLAIVLLAFGIAYAKMDFSLGMSLGSGSVSVTGPVTPTGHYLFIDGANHYLRIDNAGHKLRIDGAS